jgi:hypothetical protein
MRVFPQWESVTSRWRVSAPLEDWATSTKETPMICSTPTSARELHSRAADGIHVRLLWSQPEARVWVAVADHKAASEFTVEVREHAHALEAFHHPYAYAANYGVDTCASGPTTPASALAA